MNDTTPPREIHPLNHEDPDTCDHEWETHLWEAGMEYCPYCASTRPAGDRR